MRMPLHLKYFLLTQKLPDFPVLLYRWIPSNPSLNCSLNSVGSKQWKFFLFIVVMFCYLLSVNYNAKDLLPQVSRGGNFPELANETVLLQFATCSTFTWQCMCFHLFMFMILNVFWEKSVKVVYGISITFFTACSELIHHPRIFLFGKSICAI